jgi:hypothetical protein
LLCTFQTASSMQCEVVDGVLVVVLAAACCRPVNPHPEPQWSGAHRGLALYVSRLLAPVWDVKVITPSSNNANVWKARLTEQTMSVSGGGCCCCRIVWFLGAKGVLVSCAAGGTQLPVRQRFKQDHSPWCA